MFFFESEKVCLLMELCASPKSAADMGWAHLPAGADAGAGAKVAGVEPVLLLDVVVVVVVVVVTVVEVLIPPIDMFIFKFTDSSPVPA